MDWRTEDSWFDSWQEQDILTCICLMAGGLLVKRDVRMSHDVTSDRHTNEKIC